jgi:hypothetical protein
MWNLCLPIRLLNICLFSQVDEEGHRHVLLDDIINFWKDQTAVDKANAFIIMKNGVKRRRQTTQGWQLLCQWKDGSSNWVALKDMKNSYPVKVAEYAKANRIDDEPAFAWWAEYTLRKHDQILSKTKTKYWQRTHKFGIRVPKTVAEARDRCRKWRHIMVGCDSESNAECATGF